MKDIQGWAVNNGMHAIVGVRVLSVESVSGGSNITRYTPTQTWVTYVMYGTAIRYRDQ
jgi:hypothetical protein